jgi:hypothetical protein
VEPIEVIKWKCPICDYEDKVRSNVVDHIKLWKVSNTLIIPNDTAIAIKNKYPANTFSVARVKDWFYNGHHYIYYYLDRLLLFKDSDNFPEGLEGDVVSEFEIIGPDLLKDYRFEQARSFKKDDIDILIKEIFQNCKIQ